jgi:Ca2+/Na+ antiporter
MYNEDKLDWTDWVVLYMLTVCAMFIPFFGLHLMYNVIKFWMVLFLSAFVSPLIGYYLFKKELTNETTDEHKHEPW